jgi:hypothetical protein|tara:strand:+ start:8313 stop:9296 length:984 start_codon:yes stop_codon:yes gene_type:complete
MALFGKAHKIDSELQDRSRLTFEFPDPAYGDRICPFFENPKITEKKSSNLVTYDVLGRTSNFFGYTGAKSKEYRVEFFITLPNVVHTATNTLFDSIPRDKNKLQRQQDFFNKTDESSEEHGDQTEYLRRRKAFLSKINGEQGLESVLNSVLLKAEGLKSDQPVERMIQNGVLTYNKLANTSPELDLANELDAYDKPFIFAQAIDMLLFWVDLIRCSTLTARKSPTLGPPIIRIDHGVLYDNVATIAKAYSIDIEEAAGYDIVTLLPNRIKVTLTLLEVQRSYDFRATKQTAVRHTDMLEGWDDLLEQHDKQYPAYGKSLFNSPRSLG